MRPTVLFVDHEGWSGFDQLACACRRDAVRTIKIGARAGGWRSWRDFRWWADRLFYDLRLSPDDPRDGARLKELLATGQISDVIIAELSLALLGLDSELGHLLMAHSLAFHGTPARILLDKFEVNRRLGAIAIDVPRQVPVTNGTPQEMVGRFGLPIVLKARLGAAGENVRIVQSEAEIGAAIQSLADRGGELFYQEYIAGDRVSYNAVAGPDGPLLEHGFISIETQYPMGPSALVRCQDDPELLRAGRAAAALFGCQGFVSFGFIRDAQGRLFHLDANIRPWGSLLAPLCEGIDFATAYTDLLRTRSLSPVKNLAVLPGTLVRAKTAPAFLRGLTALWQVYAPRLSFRYAALISILALVSGLARSARRAGRLLRERRAFALESLTKAGIKKRKSTA